MLVDYVSMLAFMFMSNYLLKRSKGQITDSSTVISNCYAISADAFCTARTILS